MEPEERKPRGNTVLLTIIAVATLLVAVIGATFAYFSVTISGNSNVSTSVIVRTANLGIIYNTGNEILLENAIPGKKATKTMTVKNNGEIDLAYVINWAEVDNDFATQADLVYYATGSTDGANNPGNIAQTACPDADGLIKSVATLAPGETHTYSFTVEFLETGSPQNENQGVSFTGKIVVDSPSISQTP